MVKQAKGFSLNLGPVKKELLDFAQGFGVLTTQLGQFMQTMGNVQKASQGFGANPLFGQVMNTPNQGTGYQTPVGMQAQAAAQQAGWAQQPSYQERFSSLTRAAVSREPIEALGLNHADQAIVAASREAMRQSSEVVRDIQRTNHSVNIRANQNVSEGAAQGPIVRSLVEDMKASGMSPAQAALEMRRISPDAASTLSSLGGGGFMRQARMEAMRPEEDLQSVVNKQQAIATARRSARAMPDQSELQAEREQKLEDIRIQNLKQGFNVSFQVGRQARTAMTRAAVTGDDQYKYGLGDVVAAKGLMRDAPGKDQDAITKFTEKLKISSDALDRGLGMELDKMSGRFETLSKRFQGLNEELQKNEVGSERYNKVLAELARTGGELVQVDKDRKEASEQGGGPGGGDGGGPTQRQRWARGLQGFQALAGLGMAGMELGFGVQNNMVRQNIGAERRALSYEAEVNQTSFQRKREAADMTSVENRLKYRGDLMLSPNQLKDSYLGAEGQQKALNLALKETFAGMNQEQRESWQKVLKGTGQIAMGGIAAAGGALTAETGIGLMVGAGGVHQMVGGAGQIAGGFNTDLDRLRGEGMAARNIGRWLGATPDMVEEDKREAFMKLNATILKRTEEIQNADVQRFAETQFGMEQREAARQTQIQGAALVGPYSVSGMEMAQPSIEAAMSEGERARTTSLDDSSKAFRRVSELTHGRAVGDIERFRTDRVNNTKVNKEAMLFTMQGLESSFGKYTDTGGQSTAAGAYQMLGVVGLKGYEYARQSNPNLTRAEFDRDPRSQSASMAKILDEYNPSFFKKAAPGISDVAALLIEHKQGQNQSGRDAARAYQRGEDYFDSHGANVTQYVREGVATFEIKDRQHQIKEAERAFANLQKRPGIAGTPSEMAARRALDEKRAGLQGEIDDRLQSLGAGLAKASSPTEYMNRQLLASRKAEEGVDKYFNDNKGVALDAASRFGMTYSEFGRQQNIVSNFIGVDAQGRGRAGAGMTSELIGMSRGGLGSFEQLMGNMQGLNQARGGQNNMDALRDVMASAVTAGFDKSRTAQQFVTSVTTLAQSMDVTNTADLSERMAAGAMMMSATPGLGDERSMMLAQRGIQQADRFTGQTTGYVGANKLNALISAGATMGTGLGILQKMNYSQTSAGLRELDQANSLSDIKQEDIRALVGQYGSFAEGKKKVQAQLNAASRAERDSAFTAMKLFGKNPADALGKLKQGDVGGIERVLSEAYVQGSGTTLGSSGAVTMMIDKMREMHLITGRDQEKYQKRYRDGVAMATDVAAQENAHFKNQHAEKSATDVKTANEKQLKDFFGDNGVLRSKGGATVSAEQYQKYAAHDAAFMSSPEGKRVAQQLAKTTTDDLGLSKRGSMTPDPNAGPSSQFLGPAAAKALGDAIGSALSTGDFGRTMTRLSLAIERMNSKNSSGTKGLGGD